MYDAVELYERFCQKWKHINDLSSIALVLQHDLEIQVPLGGKIRRAGQSKALEEEVHRLLTDNDLASILLELKDAAEVSRVFGPIAVRNIELAYEQVSEERKLPASLVAELAQQSSFGFSVWEEAKRKNDFSILAPVLEKIVALTKEYARIFADDGDLYTILLQDYDSDFECREILTIARKLEHSLMPMIDKLRSCHKPDRTIVRGPYKMRKLHAVACTLAEALGFDADIGRIDLGLYPSNSGVPGDQRIITRYQKSEGLEALYSMVHEMGHYLYEQGLPREHYGLPIGEAQSFAVHESQSRFWEVCVGKSRAFCAYLLPLLQQQFPAELGDCGVQALYQSLNALQLEEAVRLKADPLTYNLYLIMNLQLEQALIMGDLTVGDLPDAWAEKSNKLLGKVPPNNAVGVLQDPHWAEGTFGYFPAYLSGNIIAAQINAAMHDSYPDMNRHIQKGEFGEIKEWLRERIHQYGAFYNTKELVRKATGHALNPQALIKFLQERYSNVYNVNF